MVIYNLILVAILFLKFTFSISYIKDPVIFSGSLRLNLDPFMKHSDAEIWEVLMHAHLHEFVKGLPQRLQYECGENGEALR